jgi:predicted signal transduction protein with EAL and GGDEF domain
LPITAEGIEDGPTKERLCRLGCSDGQGWLFGKPVSGSTVRATFGIDDKASPQVAPEPSATNAGERRDHHRRAAAAKRRP